VRHHQALLRLGSSYRARAPRATLRLARRLMPALGISRVTDITRMDRLGLPVFTSVRPRGQVLRVHAGKGLRPIDAEVGALMEAVEYAAAEPQRCTQPLRWMRVAELVAQLGGDVQLVDFAPRLGARISPRQQLATVACEDLRDGRRLALPAELVFLPFVHADNPGHFGWTSNGLASGNTLAEATLHGLLEVLERDAIAMNLAHDASHWVRTDSLPAPFGAHARRWQRGGVALAVRQVPNAFGLPCLQACLHEPTGQAVQLSAGYGLHLDPHIALARAVCEAAQSRLSHIHGARDDVLHFYPAYSGQDPADRRQASTTLAQRAFDRSRPLDFGALPPGPGPGASVQATLAQLLRRLQDAGFGAVFRHRYSPALPGLQVVKVIVPKCEQVQPGVRRLGPRLLAQLLGRPHG
jgi:ribosomal protein S12 methylthiotransferase accessory factor